MNVEMSFDAAVLLYLRNSLCIIHNISYFFNLNILELVEEQNIL